ncbi:hypothetical protein CYMTET_38428 [Cymbomonas tetramitiformis]|uniref:Uncharacterized protein n=1 Tax=Cymbomonas tetramitiformis TaxID=36881 RepID=A0AAE0CDK8_9CHLO|nr:hypothetical protein CYMTET_38428 [Cymbomonas tetramitiformis]
MRAVVDVLPGFIPGSPAASASIKSRKLQDSAFKARDRRGVISPPRVQAASPAGFREPYNCGEKEKWLETRETQDAEGLSQLTRKLCFEDVTERRMSFGSKGDNLPVREARRGSDLLR